MLKPSVWVHFESFCRAIQTDRIDIAAKFNDSIWSWGCPENFREGGVNSPLSGRAYFPEYKSKDSRCTI